MREGFFRLAQKCRLFQNENLRLQRRNDIFPSRAFNESTRTYRGCSVAQTSTLTLTNYPSLMTTNAAKYRLAVGFDKGLIEFGLRRAQGPDGGVSASRYSYMGGFDGTSNVLAGYLFGVPIRGTHAHSYVQSFTGFEDLKDYTLLGQMEKYMILSNGFGNPSRIGFQLHQ